MWRPNDHLAGRDERSRHRHERLPALYERAGGANERLTADYDHLIVLHDHRAE